jgi:3'-phosphoadenosine 5'-phosphosulfate (PAPS) 3'-phosphatase
MANRRRSADLKAPALLLAAERAVTIGADLLRGGHSHVGTLIGKGDRDYATEVDFSVERAVKQALAADAPGIPFLGEEQGGADMGADTLWSSTRSTARSTSPTARPCEGSRLRSFTVAGRYIAFDDDGSAYSSRSRFTIASTSGLKDSITDLVEQAVSEAAAAES